MNWDRIEGNWKQFSGKVQQQWGKLTDDDLKVVEGYRVELVGKIQENPCRHSAFARAWPAAKGLKEMSYADDSSHHHSHIDPARRFSVLAI